MIYEIFLRRYKTRIVGSPPLSHNMHSPVHTSLHLVTSRHFTLALHLPGTATAACSNHQSRMGVFCRRQPKSRNTTTVGPFLHSRLDQLELAVLSFLISLVAHVAKVLVFETLERRPNVNTSFTGSTSSRVNSFEPNAEHRSPISPAHAAILLSALSVS
uniref:Uncharacterized protein n=1 Tax=Cuerna arida TaxID=1464854 RepID=A0A1B6FHP7_9HEMI